MGADAETKVGFDKDLMAKVLKLSPSTGLSGKAFIEKCVRDCLSAAESKEAQIPAIVAMLRAQQGLSLTLRPDYEADLPAIREAVRTVLREEGPSYLTPQKPNGEKNAA